VCHWPLSYECVVEEDVVDIDTEMEVIIVAEYDAEGLVGVEVEDVVLEVVVKEGDVVDDVSTEEVVVVMTVLDELEDGAGAGTTMVTGGEFTSMIEYPVVVTVAGDGVIVTTTVWTVPDSSMVFVEMM
jgi:hypothetical protein